MFNNIKNHTSYMKKKYYLDIVINKEKLSNNKIIFVAHCPSLGIASQGSNTDEAMKNIKEAINLYIDEQPEKLNELNSEQLPIFSIIEVIRDAKTSNSIR